jgi:hypothetical protein
MENSGDLGSPEFGRTWDGLGDFPGVHDIVEYESRLNYVIANTSASYCWGGLAGKSILRSPRRIFSGVARRQRHGVDVE